MQGPVGVEVQLVTSLPEIRWIKNRMKFSRDLSSSAASVKRWTSAGFSWDITELRFQQLQHQTFIPWNIDEQTWTSSRGWAELVSSQSFFSSPSTLIFGVSSELNKSSYLKTIFSSTNLDSRVGSVSSTFAALSFQKIILLRQLSTWSTEDVYYTGWFF